MSGGKYSTIPETEDVTPLDNSIDKKIKISFKTIAAVIAFVVLTGSFFTYGAQYVSSAFETPLKIYQTSFSNNDRLRLLNAEDMSERGFITDKLSFGNVHCSGSGTTATSEKCTSSTNNPATVYVNSDKTFQTIVGFGGAFTEAAAYNFFKLPEFAQKKVLDLYFGENGIGYSLGRVHIGSCDFSLKEYNFDNIAGDYSMSYFDTEVTHDNAQMIPFMRMAIDASKKSSKPDMGISKSRGSPNGVNILASPWSPPPWMKTPVKGVQNMTGSDAHGLIDDPKIKAAYALYLSKFITAYGEKGIPIWALTPQNEPEFPAPWEACAYDSNYEKDFINQYLGPTIRQNNPDVLLLAFDHNKDHLFAWAQDIIGGDLGSKGGYVDGMAFHWYTGSMDRLMDGTYGYDALNSTHHYAPNKMLLGTEGCSCSGVKVDDWLRAERLAHDVIFDVENYANGWIDWNLLVDSEGGPNHLGNNCDAPLFTLPDFSDIHVQPKYYYFGHISKFVPPGSIRLESHTVGDYNYALIDPNIRAGMEIGMFKCEKSIRQMWKLNKDFNVELYSTAIDTEATDGYMAQVCIGPGDSNRLYLTIIICEGADRKPLVLKPSPDGQLIDHESGFCLSLAGEVREPGALLNLQPCHIQDNKAQDYQIFNLKNTGEIISTVMDSELCLTAGWPMLTATSFKDPQNRVVVVIMNEATVDTEIILKDSRKGDMKFGINSRSMQTIIY